MEKLEGDDIQKARHLFEDFEFYQAVIFSIFEGQYAGKIYTDSKVKPNWAILHTPFLQHIVAGNPVTGCESIVEEVFFTNIVKGHNEKEVVAFFNKPEWNEILRQIFEKHNGFSDARKIFGFSLENFEKLVPKPIPKDVQVVEEKCKTFPNAMIDTWSTKIIIDGKTVSYCNSIMVGNKKSEIDIWTEEKFQGKGYATMASMSLINNLLKDGITPCWASWPYRIESQHIAQKLGFIPEPDATAWIWMEETEEKYGKKIALPDSPNSI